MLGVVKTYLKEYRRTNFFMKQKAYKPKNEKTESESGLEKTLEKKFLQLFPPFPNVASVEGVSCSGRVLVSCSGWARPCVLQTLLHLHTTARRGEASRAVLGLAGLRSFDSAPKFLARTATATGWLNSTYLKPHHCLFSG